MKIVPSFGKAVTYKLKCNHCNTFYVFVKQIPILKLDTMSKSLKYNKTIILNFNFTRHVFRK